MRGRRYVPFIMDMPAQNGHMLVLFFLVSTLISTCSGCVPSCQCTMVGSAKRQKGRKVDCAQHPAPFKTLDNVNFPPDTVHLDLAHNSLLVLEQGSFIELSSLQKLNLSSNQITIIKPGAFEGLQSLKKLDLSNNRIGAINSNMFSGLPNLEKLFLSENRISVIPDGTFNDLRSLKRIEFNSEYLRCDCHLKWILKWTKTRHVRIPSSTHCALPAKMKGQPLSKLKRKDLHCDHNLQLPIFDIRPSESQLVFQGDKLPFECHASVTPGMEIAWFRSGQLVTNNKSMGVFVHTSHNVDRTIINHRLVVESLDSSHAGEWSCVVSTATGNLTKTVHVEVRKPEIVLECPTVTNQTAKGIYTWGESMAGQLVYQPCHRGQKGAMATYNCGVDGTWRNLNISACSYLRDISRKLSRFAKVDPNTADIPTMTHGMNKALVAAAQSGETMDPFDVYYVSKIMAILLPHAATDVEVSSLVVKIVSNVTTLPNKVLYTAQRETKSPQRIVRMLEQMNDEVSFSQPNMEWARYSASVATVVLSRPQSLHNGVSCALLGSRESSKQEYSPANFYCSSDISEMNTLVHIQIPALLARKSDPQTVPTDTVSILPLDTRTNDDVSLNETEADNSDDSSTFSNSVAGNDTSPLAPSTLSPPSSLLQPAPAPFTRPKHDTALPVDFSSLSLKHLDSLNISSEHLSKLSKLSPKNLLNLSSSLNISAKYLFPYAQNSAFPATTATPSGHSSRQGNVYVILYKNGRLFPVIRSEYSDPAFKKGEWEVVTPVVSVSIGSPAQNLSEPVVITFEVVDEKRPLKAAYYHFDIIDGYSGWKTDGCEIVQQNGSIVTVQVRHLSTFALLQDLSFVYRLASFSMEPVIYVGSVVCIFCMIIVVVTFISCFGSIGIPKKVKHAVVNVCLSTLLLMIAFVLGINRTDMELPCQIAGISIHYLTLCAVFWITITSNIIYKKFIKANRPPEPPPELVPMPLPPKPILQFYFVGYGVPLIICGITAAVNLNFYAGIEYCFLEWEPSLGAFYAPIALLVAWNLVLFMRISCVVRSVPEIDSEAANESDNEIHTNEIELVPSQPDTTITHNINSNNVNNSNINSGGSGNGGYRRRYSRASNEDMEEDAVSVTSIPDQERRPITQLRSLVAILFLFIVMWMCGALAIAKPFHLIIPYQELIFSYIYGLMSSLFGLFMILYFCITRKDSRLSWKRAGGCAPPETYTAPMEVTETTQPEPPASPHLQANGSAVKSNSNSNLSVYSQKSSNITKAYNMKNNSKQSNINLIMPTSSDISFGSTNQENFPNFYNPRQNGAAKKFWQKNRHHSKVMNKDVNRDLNSSLTDNNSGVELNHHRLSHGTSSDANTHLSIEIQIQAKDKQGSYTGSREIPVHINNYQQANAQNRLGSSCGAISIEHNSQVAAFRPSTPDTGQPSSPPPYPAGSSAGSNSNLPQHQRPPSAGSLGTGVHPSAFTPVQPRNNNTLPRHGKVGGEEGEGDPRREGSVPRNQLSGSSSQIREMDGQSQENESGQRPVNPGVAWNPLHSNLPPLPSHPATYSFTPPPPAHSQQQHYPFDFGAYPPALAMNPHIFMSQSRPAGPHSMSPTPFGQQHPHPPPFNIPPSPYLIQSQSRAPVTSMSPGSSSSHSNRKRRSSGNSWRPLSGGDSSDSSRPRHKRTSSGGSPGRTVTYAHSPVMSDSQAYEPRYQAQNQNNTQGGNKARSVDSDHHSDPTHRKKHHRSDRHSRNNKLINKQRSLGWDEQFRGRPSKVNYVYVNHMYRDKVMHKLIKQASESDDLAKKAFWLPRSASEYERLTQKGFCNMADDTTSSSEDEDSLDDNVWIRQSSGSDFHKKETSV